MSLPDLAKDVLITLGGTLLVERAPSIARQLVTLAAKAFPEPLAETYKQAWLADIDAIEGGLSKLFAAISICLQVPAIRSGHALPAIPAFTLMMLVAGINLLFAFILLGGDLLLNPRNSIAVAPAYLALYVPIIKMTFASGLLCGMYALMTISRLWRKLLIGLSMIVFIVLFMPSELISTVQRLGVTPDLIVLPMVIAISIFAVADTRIRLQYKLD